MLDIPLGVKAFWWDCGEQPAEPLPPYIVPEPPAGVLMAALSTATLISIPAPDQPDTEPEEPELIVLDEGWPEDSELVYHAEPVVEHVEPEIKKRSHHKKKVTDATAT